MPSLLRELSLRNEAQTAPGDRFPPTRWSLVDAARSADPAEQARALDTLFAAYWRPIYKYIRLRWSRPAEDAEDLTQGFFAELLERGLLARYDPAKSRLRTYLRLCADSFVINAQKAATRRKRGGAAPHLALDFQAVEGELHGVTIEAAFIPSPESLEQFFEKEWIRSLFVLALEDLRRLCEQRKRELTFRLFEDYELADDPEISYEKLSQRYAVPVTDVTNALAWARREFRRSALDRLRQICGSEEEFHREARAIFGWNPPARNGSDER
jgi:RNA polymerase sigma factor (sigma-70 family)